MRKAGALIAAAGLVALVPSVAFADDEAPPDTTVVVEPVSPGTTLPAPDPTLPPPDTTVAPPVVGEPEAPDPAEPAESPAAEAGSLTVTPSTGLVDGQVVTAHGEGWTPHHDVDLVQCGPAGQPLFRSCALLATVRTGAQGGFTGHVPLEVVVDGFEEAGFDCRVVTCRFAAAGFPGQVVRFVDLQFDPASPDPTRRTATATPDTGLVDGDEVTVTGDGFPIKDARFGGSVRMTLCRLPALTTDDCDGVDQFGFVRPNGHLDARYVANPILHLPDGTIVDCRAAACALVVRAEVGFDPEDVSEGALVPLGFDPGGALRPPPTVTADPATGLVDGDVVELDGDGFDLTVAVQVQQCVAGASSFDDCEIDVGRIFFGSGDLHGFLPVRARIPTAHGVVDCRVTACSIVAAEGGSFSRSAEAVLAFDPNGPLLDPQITVTPASGLHDGDRVTVHGTGFAPDDLVFIRQCGHEPFACDYRREVLVLLPFEGARRQLPLARTRDAAANEAGVGFEHTFTVHAQLHTSFGPVPDVDCRVEACHLEAESFSAATARAALDFADDVSGGSGPIAATPTLTG